MSVVDRLIIEQRELTPREILIGARALIEDPDNWCQYRSWNHLGQRCAVGAMYFMAYGADMPGPTKIQFTEAYRAAKRLVGDVILVNDTDGHEAVMRVFDRAIEMAV